MFGFDEITKVDPEVAAAMTDELNRQNNNPVSYTHLDVYKRQVSCGKYPRSHHF